MQLTRIVKACLLAAACTCPPAYAANSTLYRIEFADKLAAANLDDVRLQDDYGSFAVVIAGDDGARNLTARGVLAQALPHHGLQLAGKAVNFAAVGSVAPQLTRGGDFALLEMRGPTHDVWLQSLRSEHVEVLQFIAPYYYLVWARPEALQRAQGIVAVQGAALFPHAAKLGASVAALAGGSAQLKALLYRGAQLDSAAFTRVGATLIERAPIDKVFEEALISVDLSKLSALSALPGVYVLHAVASDGGLRGEASNQQLAANVGPDNLPVLGYSAWLRLRQADGFGIVIANVDGGVQESHPDLISRMLPCVGLTCGNTTQSSHGTHTAGTMVADGASNVRDARGFLRGLGVAPGAKLVEQLSYPFYTQAGGMLLLMRESAQNGALLSGNSWGPAGSPRGYDGDTRQVDVGTRDSDPQRPGDQPLTYVLSIMNGNGGLSSQGTPDEAKNVISVGSTRAQLNSGMGDVHWQSISMNSAHGPALDGRQLPHLVAPGCSQESTSMNNSYELKCGTSMASPHIAGALALFAERYRNNFKSLPSAALSKAALIASTHDLHGRNDADGVPLAHRPDSKQGWGRFRLDLLLDATPKFYVDQNKVFDATGQTQTYQLAPALPGQAVRVFLSYTDAPGHGLAGSLAAWNNDLDLEVATNGQLYKGNVFDADGLSTTGGTSDGKNNTEGVVLPAALLGTSLTLTVHARNISSDALPNAGDSTDQDFALVCVNCRKPMELFEDGFD